jgi:sugar phosphate isomerase/epimerase
MLTRREFGKLTFAGFAMAGRPEGRPGLQTVPPAIVDGVRLGVQTYSFRDIPRTTGGDAIEPIVAAMTACGLTECELWAQQVEPAGKSRDELRAWRLRTPLDHFRRVKRRFDAAGITIYAYNYSPSGNYTDAEIGRGFLMAKALGAKIITSSTTLPVARRMAPFAAKHGMVVAMHGHSNVKDPNEFATPDSFAAAMHMSKLFKVNLDIGHFTAANFDALAYIREHHASITNLHLKDRKKDQGANTPWGEGDAPIREVLQLLKSERWPIRAYIEYEYPGTGTPVEEVKKCYEYAKQALKERE